MKQIVWIVIITVICLSGCGTGSGYEAESVGTNRSESVQAAVAEIESAPESQQPQVEDVQEGDEAGSLPKGIVEFTPEEVEAVRLSLPYPGVIERGGAGSLVWEHSDERTRRLSAFLTQVLSMAGMPRESFQSPADEAARSFIIRSAFYNTETDFEYLYENHHDMTRYIFYTLGVDGVFRPREHVERTAELLFGGDVIMDHSVYAGDNALTMIRYNEETGYYGGEAFGLMGIYEPVIVELSEDSGSYELEVAFPFCHPENGYLYYDARSEEETFITEDDFEALMNFCRDSAEHHTITLKKGADGALFYHSHILPG